MKEALSEIRNSLKAGRFVNEAAVSQGIVQRLLGLLGWPVYNTEVISPEHSINGLRVDYALCHPPREPIILVEVKQVGQSKGADQQLFEYAFYKGVPMAILTDGQEWNFFLPTEQGEPDERRLYKLDILERDLEEIEQSLKRYLDYEAVCSGQAIEDARKDYRNAARRRQAQRTLPDAWGKLVEDEDDLLVELLSDKVEDLCGVKPDAEAITGFLREQVQLKNRDLPSTTPQPRPRRPRQTANSGEEKQRSGTFVGYTLNGRTQQEKNASDVLQSVLRELAELDSNFLGNLAPLLSKPGARRRYVARSREELNPDRPDLVDNAREIKSGWWVDMNISNAQKNGIIRRACEVAGLRYGEDLQVHLG